jgi:hypothetical protein
MEKNLAYINLSNGNDSSTKYNQGIYRKNNNKMDSNLFHDESKYSNVNQTEDSELDLRSALKSNFNFFIIIHKNHIFYL